MSSEEPTSREEQKMETRSKILGAATMLFMQHGIHETTTDQIANAVGVSKGTIFHHFESKEKLIGSAVNHAFESFFLSLEQQLQEREIDISYLKYLSKDFFKEMTSNPGLIKLMLDYTVSYIDDTVSSGGAGQATKSLLSEMFDPFFDTIKGILIDLGIPEEKATIRTHLFMALLDGVGLYLFMDIIPNDMDYVERLIDEFLELLTEGSGNE